MKKNAILLFSILVLGGIQNFSFALTGQLLKNQIFKSDTLKSDILYNVYLPPNYD
jgi:hypothetical protein